MHVIVEHPLLLVGGGEGKSTQKSFWKSFLALINRISAHQNKWGFWKCNPQDISCHRNVSVRMWNTRFGLMEMNPMVSERQKALVTFDPGSLNPPLLHTGLCVHHCIWLQRAFPLAFPHHFIHKFILGLLLSLLIKKSSCRLIVKLFCSLKTF